MSVVSTNSIEYIEGRLNDTERLFDGVCREAARIENQLMYWRKRLSKAQKIVA